MAGQSNYVFGLTVPLASVDGANTQGVEATKGAAGSITLRPYRLDIPSGASIELAGSPVLARSAASRTDQNVFVIADRDLEIQAGGIVNLAASNVLEFDADVTVDGSFDLGSHSQTISRLSGNGSVNLGSGSTLTLGYGAPFGADFAGNISGLGRLARISPGDAYVLSGTVSNSGGIYVEEDPLRITGATSGGHLLAKSGAGTLEISGAMNHTGKTEVQAGKLAILNGATVAPGDAIIVSGGAELDVENTAVVRAIDGASASSKITTTGTTSLGNANSFAGFRTVGSLTVNNQLTLNSRGFASLGMATELINATLFAPNGVLLGIGSNLSGAGTVNAKVAAGFGSAIDATGNLEIGKATDVTGYFSDGELYANANTVTIHDKNEAVLGSVTYLGDGVNGGSLVAGTANVADAHDHFLLEAGKNLVGRGNVAGHFKNQGYVGGDGTTLAERVVFDAPWTVSGKGTFENTLVLGTFAPGDSPAITNGSNQGFGGTVQFELGGLTPGSGNDNHDQINDSGTILLLPGVMMAIDPWSSFVPSLGDQFTVMTWVEGLDGIFADLLVDSFYTDQGLSFTATYINPTGPGSLVLTVVPEPTGLLLAAISAGGFWWLRRKLPRRH